MFQMLALLSGSFIVAGFLARVKIGFVAKLFYVISAFWFGVLINLLVGIFFAYLLATVLKFLKINFQKKYIGLAFLSLSIFLSLYGLFNATNPRIKNIEVALKDLPAEWEGKKIVQISDVHLGMVHGKDFLTKVVNRINTVNAEAVLITGDLFDGMDNFDADLVSPFKDLKAEYGTYFITGNHEMYLGYKPVELLDTVNIKNIDNKVATINGLQLVGIGYSYEGDGVSFFQNLKDNGLYTDDTASILLHHTPTNIMRSKDADLHSSAYIKPDMSFDIAQVNGIDLQLSGHTHKGQLYPFNLFTKYIFKGLDYGLHTFGDFSLYTSSGVGTWGPPMRTGSYSEIVVITLKKK